jgi:hypothetical protein
MIKLRDADAPARAFGFVAISSRDTFFAPGKSEQPSPPRLLIFRLGNPP